MAGLSRDCPGTVPGLSRGDPRAARGVCCLSCVSISNHSFSDGGSGEGGRAEVGGSNERPMHWAFEFRLNIAFANGVNTLAGNRSSLDLGLLCCQYHVHASGWGWNTSTLSVECVGGG